MTRVLPFAPPDWIRIGRPTVRRIKLQTMLDRIHRHVDLIGRHRPEVGLPLVDEITTRLARPVSARLRKPTSRQARTGSSTR